LDLPAGSRQRREELNSLRAVNGIDPTLGFRDSVSNTAETDAAFLRCYSILET